MTSEAWIALIGVLGTLLGTLGSAYLTNRWAVEREERQWARQKQDEHRKVLRDACENFAALAMLTASGIDQFWDPEAVIRGMTRVRVLSPGPIAQQAQNLFMVCSDAHTKWKQAESQEERNEALASVQPAVDAFLILVHRELQKDTST